MTFVSVTQLEDLLFYHITREGLDAGGELTTGEHASRVRFDPRSAIFVCNKWDQVGINLKPWLHTLVSIVLYITCTSLAAQY